ncbi:STAS domain-containing protein [Chungangia koreensis]|uniref:STAS domain-containing protein n=1 Tax=Chungangia koreensis TaxID=752657 RepID=A0ABV8X7M7_9LACT
MDNIQEELQKKVQELSQQVENLEALVKELSTPIIPSVIPETILVPLVGELSPERFQTINHRLLEYVYNKRIQTAIIDFSAITVKEISNFEVLAESVGNLNASMDLMGVKLVLVGFTPHFAQELVRSGLSIIDELNTFSSFKTALEYFMKQQGMAFTKVKN